MMLQIRQWMQKFDALSQRERLLILAALLAVLYGIADALFFQPWRVQHKQLNQQLKDGQMQISAVSDAITARMQVIRNDPDQANRQRLQEVQRETAKIQQEMRLRQQTLIAAQQMPHLLQALLQQHPKVALRAFKTLPLQVVHGAPTSQSGTAETAGQSENKEKALLKAVTQPTGPGQNSPPGASAAAASSGQVAAQEKVASLAAVADKEKSAAAHAPRLYKHELELELVGNYLDILAWLQALEKSPWQLYWGQTSLRTEKYPESVLVLRVFTLSMDQAWLDL